MLGGCLGGFILVIWFVAGIISPRRSARTKYCPQVRGGYSMGSFNAYRLPTSIVVALVNASNQSLAMTTWASYRTAEAHLKRCEADTGVRMRFPMDDRQSSRFLYWVYSLLIMQGIQSVGGMGLEC